MRIIPRKYDNVHVGALLGFLASVFGAAIGAIVAGLVGRTCTL